jgi:plasmid stabilization system protein ParE
MARILHISTKARVKMLQIADYISTHFGTKRGQQFMLEINAFFEDILAHPRRHPTETEVPGKTPLKRAVFQKRTIIYYRITNTSVTITVVHAAKSNWRR